VVHVEEREGTAAGLFAQEEGEVERITVDRLSEMLSEPDPPVVLDVWSRSGYEREPWRVPGSVRVLPDEVAEWAEGQDPDRLVVAYCT
jgi:rhodanese-related sulfurtransferase